MPITFEAEALKDRSCLTTFSFLFALMMFETEAVLSALVEE